VLDQIRRFSAPSRSVSMYHQLYVLFRISCRCSMFPRIQNPSHDAGRVLTCYQSPRLLYDTLDLKGSCSQPEKTGHAPFHISCGYRRFREMIWILQTKAWVSISFFQLQLHEGFIDVSYYCILASRSGSWVMNPRRNEIFSSSNQY